jgi:hypothetical protein
MASTTTAAMAPMTAFLFFISLSIVSSLALIAELISAHIVVTKYGFKTIWQNVGV